jgi:branched-chain amino acid transport system permease protein
VTHAVVLADTFDTQINLVKPILDGIFQGSAYGLLALGLVLLYKSNRIFNFAQGEFATVAALVAYLFDTGNHLDVINVGVPKVPYGVAILLGIAAAVLVALATERAVIRPMFDRPRVVLVVGTIGVTLLLVGLEGTLYPHVGALRTVSDALNLKHAYAGHIDGIPVDYQNLLNLGMLLLLAAAAFLFFRFTRTGMAILAVSQDATAARVVGISVERISQVTWAIAGLLGGVAGVLLAVPPQGSVTPGGFTGTSLTIAFAAAVLGGFTSLPGAFAGGILIGLVESFADADYSFVPGLSHLPSGQAEVGVAVVLLVVLLVRPRGLFGAET